MGKLWQQQNKSLNSRRRQINSYRGKSCRGFRTRCHTCFPPILLNMSCSIWKVFTNPEMSKRLRGSIRQHFSVFERGEDLLARYDAFHPEMWTLENPAPELENGFCILTFTKHAHNVTFGTRRCREWAGTLRMNLLMQQMCTSGASQPTESSKDRLPYLHKRTLLGRLLALSVGDSRVCAT